MQGCGEWATAGVWSEEGVFCGLMMKLGRGVELDFLDQTIYSLEFFREFDI